jgi:hypothetical protein
MKSAKPTTGAVDKYVMKFCIEGIYFLFFSQSEAAHEKRTKTLTTFFVTV